MNNFNPYVKSLLLDGPMFPVYIMSSILGRHDHFRDEINKQRIIQILKHYDLNSKKIYLSNISELLMLPLDDTYRLLSNLKNEGKIK